MTPVLATKTSSSLQASSSAARARTRFAASYPSLPVTAFAQPALTTTAFKLPPVFFKAFFDNVTGAAWKRFFVKTAAALAPSGATISPRSGRFLRMPARMPEARKPFGSLMIRKLHTAQTRVSVPHTVAASSTTGWYTKKLEDDVAQTRVSVPHTVAASSATGRYAKKLEDDVAQTLLSVPRRIDHSPS